MNGIKDINIYKDLIHQLLLGTPVLPVFWFQFCLIIWTIILLILIFSFKTIYNYLLVALFIIILYLNSFEYTNLLIKNYISKRTIVVNDLFKKSIYMFSGYFFGSVSILSQSLSIKIKIICISFIVWYLLQYSDNFYFLNHISIQCIINIIFITFSLYSFDIFNSSNINYIINQISKHSGGIYYIHWEIKHRTFSDFSLIKKANFMSCIIIYLICYFFCFFSFKIFKNTKLKYLFI